MLPFEHAHLMARPGTQISEGDSVGAPLGRCVGVVVGAYDEGVLVKPWTLTPSILKPASV